MRRRFILSHLLPILLVVPLFGLVFLYLLESQVLLAGLSEDISEKAKLIAQSINSQPELIQDAGQAQIYLATLSRTVDEQIVLLAPDGRVVAASPIEEGEETIPAEDLPGLDTAVGGQESTTVTYNLREQRAIVLVPVQGLNEQLVGIVGVTDTLAGTAAQFGGLRVFLLVIILLELLLGALIGLLLARRLELPIGQAISSVVALGLGRESATVVPRGPREIRQLAESVNLLRERLRLLEETRRRSLANIVHEIGRPLGAIRSATHVLRQGAGDDPLVREELLAGIEQAIIRLQPLLDDLTQLHGQVQGTIKLSPRPVALSEWLPTVLLPWRAAAQEKGLQWQADIDSGLPVLEIDPDRMGQVVGNLLSNAIKYTPEPGQVTVAAEADPGAVRISVTDTGPGILPEEREQIFEPFYRSAAERRFPQGLGLGLTIAREMVVAHGGRLTLDSTPGKGSRFTIEVPLVRPEADDTSGPTESLR
jgi:signal transduction histidine kinase